MIIFEVIDKLNKKIRLTDAQWFHILLHHPEMSNQENKIIETLRNADKILYDKQKDNHNYYKLFQKTPVSRKFLHVIIKHLNSEGFIITSYFTGEIRETDREIVYENDDEL